jgi:hypothetical protein
MMADSYEESLDEKSRVDAVSEDSAFARAFRSWHSAAPTAASECLLFAAQRTTSTRNEPFRF